MKIPAAVKTFQLKGKEYTIATLKAKHLIAIEKGYRDIGDVEKGVRLAALLLLESMGAEALSYDELIDFELDELTPLLEALGSK